MHIDSHQSRRTFLRRTASLGALGSAAALVNSLGIVGEAAASTLNDYKAIVCIFLYGGNDYANTLIPFDGESYRLYSSARPDIAIDQADLVGTVLQPSDDLGGRMYALNPALASIKPLFDNGQMAVLMNVGTLIRPLTRQQYLNDPTLAPPQIFSHNSQQTYFQTGHIENRGSGWGGRIGDLLQSSNGTAQLTCVSAHGNASFLSGDRTVHYSVGPKGAIDLLNGRIQVYRTPASLEALRQLMLTTSDHVIGEEYAKIVDRAFQLNESVNSALSYAPEGQFNRFPNENGLAKQLKIIARIIASSAQLGIRRQVFFASMGGFDTHSGLNSTHPVLLRYLSEALKAFYDTTVGLGVSEQVTTFTASDFGRTLASNGDGSDHGWGNTHFVLGGAVKGQRLYGTLPLIGLNTINDVGEGRLLPTTSVDQLAATLAGWFGVSSSNLTFVLPNLVNFSPQRWNLGFL